MTNPASTKRKLVLKMSVSLDGFVAGADGELDWLFRSSSDDSRAWVLQTLREAGVHIMGSRSYRDMAAYWPYSDLPMAVPMNYTPKVVFSRTGIEDGTRSGAPRQGSAPTSAVLRSWAEPEVAGGDLVREILRLKQQPGDLVLAHGGARFAQSLVASGLVDEYRLGIHPVVLGRGQPLFSALRSPVDLRLVSAIPFSGGAVGIVYRPI